MPVAHYQLMAGILIPIFTAALAFVVLGESVGIRFFLAIPIIFFGLYLALVK